MKRHATTVVLLLVACALAAWVWLDRDKVTEGERKKRDSNVFSAWRREDLRKIEIAHEGETIVIERSSADDAWRMTSPRSERVDQGAAERLTTTLEFASVIRKVGEDAKLGFDAPRAAGKITMRSLVFQFVLGGTSPRPEGSSYFRVDSGAPFVVSKELTETLLASSDTYRDRSVVPYLSLEIGRFELRHPGGGFALERDGDRSFKVAGIGASASRTALDKVWGALAEMRAEAFPKDADADRLTQDPLLTITMAPKVGGKPASEIVIGGPCPGHPNDVVVLRRSPTRAAACVPKGVVDALVTITPLSLVDLRPFSFRHDEIEELRLERLGQPRADVPAVIEVARRGTGFHQRLPEDRQLASDEGDSVSELLAMIEQGKAEELLPPGAAFVPAARARVHAGDQEETIEIEALPPAGRPDARVRARRLRDGALLALSLPVARRLFPRATTTRPRTLVADTRRVERVALRCGVSQDLVDSGSGLRLVEPAGYETDGSIVQLVDGLVRGKAIAWVGDDDDGSFGLAPTSSKGGCAVSLSFAGASDPVTVVFGDEAEGGVYGKIEGKRGVFVAPSVLRELAKRFYVSHGALRAEPAQIESVKVVRRGKVQIGLSDDALRSAAGALFADSASPDGGPIEPDVEIVIAVAEAGAPKRVVCSAADRSKPTGQWRRCTTPGVKAVFSVRASLVDAFLEPAAKADASASPSVP